MEESTQTPETTEAKKDSATGDKVFIIAKVVFSPEAGNVCIPQCSVCMS